MKKLDFEQFEKPNEAFAVIWMAFRSSFPRKASGYEQMKLCNRVGEKLESISTEEPTPYDATNRVLRAKVTSLILPPMEWDKLASMLKDEQTAWTYLAAPYVEKVIEAMDAAPTVEVQEKPKLVKSKKAAQE